MDKLVIILILVVLFSMMLSSIGGGAFLYQQNEEEDDEDGAPGGGSGGGSGSGGGNDDGSGTQSTTGPGGFDDIPPSGQHVTDEYASAPEESGTTPCAASLCTGSKVIRTKPGGTPRMGTTADICCRDKACQIDWDPASGGNPQQCKEVGMVFNSDYTDANGVYSQALRSGKTNTECCKEDTTSYSKWCVQEVAYKADGTTEKTASPFPWWGGNAETHWRAKIAGSPNSHSLGSDPVIALRLCKEKCDEVDDCEAIHLETDGTCRLQKAIVDRSSLTGVNRFDELTAGYEKYSKGGDGMVHPKSGAFYIKSGFVPEGRKTSGPIGAKKVAGVDEDYCPLKYTSIYGAGNLDGGEHAGHNVDPNILLPALTPEQVAAGAQRPANACFAGATAAGGGQWKGGDGTVVTLLGPTNSPEPIIRRCGELCDTYDTCGGFFTDYVGGGGRCCLKGDLTARRAPTSSLIKDPRGASFIRVRDGVMGNRPSRKNV